MVANQAINKILIDKDINFILSAGITKEYFTGYEDEFNFIRNHFNIYKNVPDKETFIDKFEDFEFLNVTESNEYIVAKLREEFSFNRLVPIIQTSADLLNEDANKSISYLQKNINNITPSFGIKGIDIISHAKERLDQYEDRKINKSNWCFKSGFDELDLITNGIQRGEELLILFARTNQGKSWVSEKMAISVWEQNYNVGYFSPEMSSNSIGYRFDTLHRNFENYDLVHGNTLSKGANYKEYIKDLQKNPTAKFLVTTPADFGRKPTVSKISSWIKENDLKLVVLDGLSYIQDDRGSKRDNLTTSLTNISEDLMSLSVELKVPIIAVVQANREAAGEDKTSAPTLETIRNSDGISHNASKVISLRNRNGVLELNILKQRNGIVGNKLMYHWDINTGTFVYMPNPKANLPGDTNEQAIKQQQDKYSSDTDNIF